MKLLRSMSGAALGALALAGLSGNALAAAGDECVKVLGYEWSGEKQSMDPADMHSGDDAYHTFAVYNRLVDLDDNFNVLPELATEWSASEDGLTWTFKLREGVKFHSGKDFSSADVVYTFKRLLDEKTGSGARAVMEFLDPDGIAAPDANTVTFTTKTPVVELPILITNKFTNIVPDGAKQEDLRKKGDGTGPFMQEEFTPNAPVRILRKNPNYWDAGKPKAECLKITVAQEAVAGVSAIKSGEVDLMLNVDPSVIPALKDDPSVSLLETAASNSMTISMWVDTKPFDDIKVREALKAVVDRQAMIDTVLLGFGEPGADNPVPVPNPASYVKEAPKQDIELAKKLLAEAGYAEIRPLHGRGRARHGAHGPGLCRNGKARGHRGQRHRDSGRELLGRCLAEAIDRHLRLVDAPAGRGARRCLYPERQVEGNPLGTAGLRRLASEGEHHGRRGRAPETLPADRRIAGEGRRSHPADVRPPGSGGP